MQESLFLLSDIFLDNLCYMSFSDLGQLATIQNNRLAMP